MCVCLCLGQHPEPESGAVEIWAEKIRVCKLLTLLNAAQVIQDLCACTVIFRLSFIMFATVIQGITHLLCVFSSLMVS